MTNYADEYARQYDVSSRPHHFGVPEHMGGPDYVDFGDAGFSFGGLVSSIGSAVSSVAAPIAHVAFQGEHLLQEGLEKVSNNPLWKAGQMAASFIPGVGTAVSAGMAGAAAIGRGESVKDIALEAARSALPGGPVTAAAFDIATGLAKGKGVTDSILQVARNQIPGGDIGKAAFDAAITIARGAHMNPQALAAIRKNVPGGAEGKRLFDAAVKTHRAVTLPSKPIRFPGLTAEQNRVASTMQMNPALFHKPAREVARHVGTATDNARAAIARFLNKWKGQPIYAAHDVGDFDSAAACCEREGVEMDLASGNTGATFARIRRQIPRVRVPISRVHLVRLYEHGSTPIKKALLAHGLLARIAHTTGELNGAGGWTIRSGDTGYGIAKKLTGDGNRWREILAVNPSLKVVQVGTTTQIKPFNVGQQITIPTGWLGTAAPVAGPTAAVANPVAVAKRLQGMPTISKAGPNDITTVKIWQRILRAHYPDSNIDIDGSFGDITDAGTVQLQAEYGLNGDGVVGPQTWAKAAEDPVAIAAVGGGGAAVPVTPPRASTPTAPAGPAPSVPSSADEVTTAVVQAMLASFYQFHGSEIGKGDFSSSSIPTYGSDPEDLSGVWTDRSLEAMSGFQNWRNVRPVKGVPPLPEDGMPDQASVNALQSQNAADLARVSGAPVPIPSGGTVQPAGYKPPAPAPRRPTPPGPAAPGGPTPPAPTQAGAASGGSDNSGLLLLGLGAAAVFAMSGRHRRGARRRAA